MAHIDIIKPWFLVAKKPTQAQFHQWMDWLRWTDQLIGLTDLTQEVIDMLNVVGSSNRPERKEVTGDDTFTMLAEFKLNSIAIKNPSAFDLVFTVDYPGLGAGVHFLEIAVPASGQVDVEAGKTFWTNTTLTITEETGVDFSATPVIFLIDRK